MHEEQRARRRKRQLRPLVEASAVALLLIVVLVFAGFVLTAGKSAALPPANTLVVAQTDDFTSLDPALATTPEAWELEYATCAKLFDYTAASGYRGTRVRSEIAKGPPHISPDRLTYRIVLRRGWRFSNGSPVTAAAFARAFARARSPELVSPAGPYLREVVGWRARGLVFTVRLSRPAPDFTQRLALPYFCAVPPSTPDTQRDVLPSAGPFYVARYDRGRMLLLRRNPYYHGTRPRRVAQIEYEFGAFPSEILLELQRGEADYGVVNPSAFAALAAKLGAERRHLLVFRQPTVAYLALNTRRPLFRDNPQLRRAVNFALDRPTLARLFGPDAASPADEYLPPGFPGYQRAHIYPVDGPALATARRLAHGHLRGGHAVFLACGSQDCQERAVAVAAALRKIGLHVRIDSPPGYGRSTLASVRGTSFDIADITARPDYGDPYALIEKLLDGRAIRAVGNTNVSYFDNLGFDRALDKAQRLRGLARDRAYGRLGVAVARTDAPLAAYAVLNARVFLSARVGCITYQPVYGLDLAGACLAPSPRRD